MSPMITKIALCCIILTTASMSLTLSKYRGFMELTLIQLISKEVEMVIYWRLPLLTKLNLNKLSGDIHSLSTQSPIKFISGHWVIDPINPIWDLGYHYIQGPIYYIYLRKRGGTPTDSYILTATSLLIWEYILEYDIKTTEINDYLLPMIPTTVLYFIDKIYKPASLNIYPSYVQHIPAIMVGSRIYTGIGYSNNNILYFLRYQMIYFSVCKPLTYVLDYRNITIGIEYHNN